MAKQPQNAASRSALIIGGTGGIGRAVATALAARGWNVKALHREPERGKATAPDLPVAWIKGDAMNEAEVIGAVDGARLLFHGANPPGYRRWRELAIPMLANSITAAKRSGSRLIFPGNVYNFGSDAGVLVNESSPQHPKTRKGAVRVEMEGMLSDAAANGVRSIVVRAGDFLGNSSGSWFKAVMVKPGQPLKSVTYPGKRDVGHAWAYLPDLGETIARLAEVERELDAFEVFHFGGHWIEPGVEICHAVRRASGRPDLPIRSFPWIAVCLAAPFSGFMRELLEMRYLWQVPLRLDNAKLVAGLGEEPHTLLDEAVAQTLRSMEIMK
jgi:nucleoside-diphosphate-sugar epimerase